MVLTVVARENQHAFCWNLEKISVCWNIVSLKNAVVDFGLCISTGFKKGKALMKEKASQPEKSGPPENLMRS